MHTAAALARRASTAATAVLVALLTWRPMNFRPPDGLDPSWQAALHMAAHRGMPFLTFTYGPLAFLAQPVAYYGWTAVLSAIYVFVVEVAFAAALVSILRRAVGLPAAGVVTLLLLAAVPELRPSEVIVVVVMLVAVALLSGIYSPRTEQILVGAGGLLAGTSLLVKFNTGLTTIVVGAITVWFVGRRTWRSEALFVTTTAGGLLGGWLLSGNSLGALPSFVARSMQVTRGYSEAMGIEAVGRGVYYPLAALAIALLVALGAIAGRGRPISSRLALAAAGAFWIFAAFKLGFVRHDGHDIGFFAEVSLVSAGVAAAAATTVPRFWKALPAVAAVPALVTYLVAGGISLTAVVNPVPAVARMASDVGTLASPPARDRAIDKGRARLRRFYGLSPAILAPLVGHTTHIRPWEAGIAWAYPEIGWRPLPVFQEYTAYTADLDHLNADYLAGPQAPERILTEEKTVDGRFIDWESPATVVALACHYRQLAAEAHWQVLGRVPNRCGPEGTLGVVKASIGDIVPVPLPPDPNSLVVARITGLDYSPFWGLRSALFRAPEVHVKLSGNRRFRLVPGTAADGLVVRAPRERLGFAQPFALETSSFLRVDVDPGFGVASHVNVEFLAIPVLN